MQRTTSRFLIVCGLIVMVGILLPEPTVAATAPMALDRIEKDFNDGLITIDERAILQITAIKDAKSLPNRYATLATASDFVGYRGATVALIAIRQSWDFLSDETRRSVSLALARQTTEFEYVSPSGFFRLHYDLTGTSDAVSSVDADMDGIPDFVEACASYLDTSLSVHRSEGYFDPPSDGGLGGDGLFDVYFEDMEYYGYAVPESPGPESWNDYTSYLVLHNTYIGFPSNDDPEGDIAGAAKATAAHEFHHCVQFAYDINEGVWFMELDATYMEDVVFDQVNDNHNYLPYFFGYPQTSLMHNLGLHPYSSFIWGRFLAEKFASSVMADAWEGARWSAIYDAMEVVLLSQFGWTQDSAMAEFALWNYCTGSRDDGLHYVEAADYPNMTVGRFHSTYPVSLQNSPASVGGYAASYVTFYPTGEPRRLRVNFNGSDSRQWEAYLIKSISPTEHEFQRIDLNQTDFSGYADVDDFDTYYSVTLVGMNLSQFSEVAFYTYSAQEINQYGLSSTILTTDSVVYSGGYRDIEVQVTNTSEVLDVVNFIAWDDLGWYPLDTIQLGVYPGYDAIASIRVHPFPGTPLGTISTLHIRVESNGDPEIGDDYAKVVEAVMQRGDVDFSGQMDVQDLLYLVRYSFLGGPAPIPSDVAADFDCSGRVDASDLARMVKYAFHGGPGCPCNPY